MRSLGQCLVRATWSRAGQASQEGEWYCRSEPSREGQPMRITRRDLTIASALTLGGVGLWRSSAAAAATPDQAARAQAVARFRKGGFGQEKNPVGGVWPQTVSEPPLRRTGEGQG